MSPFTESSIVFDFTAAGSACEELAHERAARVLHQDDALRAGALWSNLIELAEQIAIAGGDRTRVTLLESLVPLAFRFAGERRSVAARAALAEASDLALSDIENQVGTVVLTRHERIALVHEALDHGRYVEIRGEAGVGKSGVLRQLAEQIAAEGRIVVLSPGRCEPRGWPAMKARLGFDGTARDLLIDLANDGGATLFIDNLDSFDEDEQKTAIDLVREASKVPGFCVVATARIGFGIEEPNWLPPEALARLVKAAPIVVDQLSKAEIDQLRLADPTLGPLLTEAHPARQVTRNLFRLARLAGRPVDEPMPRTEVEMADQWWTTADGKAAGLRDRSRLLHALAEQTLRRADKFDVKDHLAASIDALIASGTLRDLGSDRVAFRHDVFREWAVANLLYADAARIDELALDRPAPATLARGIELAARMTLERAADGKAWHSMLQRLSQSRAHQSWRRAALLALVRSEAGITLLERTSPELLADGATLLRELLRTVMAVEVVPAAPAFAAAGVDPTLIPASLNMPRGPSWLELILWLLRIDEGLPPQAIPEVVELYTGFSLGTLGSTELTLHTTRCLYRWLRMMEPNDAPPAPGSVPPFWHDLERGQVRSLKDDLRSGFLMFCRHTPELAAEYLRAVAKSEHNDQTVRSILKLRGSLAQAAPQELAELVASALIEQPRPRERFYGRERDEPFTFLDKEFLSPSPAQGPFFELLSSSPKDGLWLVRRLVDHAVAHSSGGRAPGTNAITLAMPDGPRSFPWTQSYFWSRNSHFYGVTSALMALEAWTHRRIDAGEEFNRVLADVLGPTGSCAAYLLVAVDVMISHWPKSQDAAAAFLANPVLLCLDHTRQVHDTFESRDSHGFGSFRKEPRGAVSAAELKGRTSRHYALDALIGKYSLSVSDKERDSFVTMLNAEAERLGPPGDQDTLGDPAFMALHALHLADPANWPEVTVALDDGTTRNVRKYVSPATESRHLQALTDAAANKTADFSMQTSISLATDDPARLSRETRSVALQWAREVSERPSSDVAEDDGDGTNRMRSEAVLTAAMILMRDAEADERAEHGEWARGQFSVALQTEDDPVHQIRGGIRFNPIAIAYVGIIYSLRDRATGADIRTLLEVAAQDNPAAAHGFGAAVSVLDAFDSRLTRSILRCAFVACIRPHRKWNLPDVEVAARAERRQQRANAAVDAEVAWLGGERSEPEWPAFPFGEVRRRRGLRLPGGVDDDDELPLHVPPKSSDRLNHQAAALWLRQVRTLFDVTERPWLRSIAEDYMPWTIAANGAGLNAGDEIDHAPREWNDVFFALAARCAVGLSFDQVAQLAITPITTLPDRHFFDVLADFQRSVDAAYFGVDVVPEPVAVDIRAALAKRMMSSRGWERMRGSKDMSIEMHIGPAIAVLFLNDHHFAATTKCYLFPKGVERLGPFLPIVEAMVKDGPSPFVALVLLNLLEVAPRAEHLPLLVTAGTTWLESYPDYRPFWVDYGTGRRFCVLVENIRSQAPQVLAAELPIRLELDRVLASLVSLGVPEASRLEEALSAV